MSAGLAVAGALRVLAGVPRIQAHALRIQAGALRIQAGALRIQAGALRIRADALRVLARTPRILAHSAPLVAALVLQFTCPAYAENVTLAQIHPGAIEFGASGAFTSVENTTRSDIGLSGGQFFGFGSGLAAGELRIGYAHISSLDRLDLEVSVSWQRALQGTSIYPYLAVGGGVRQEWVGSFREARYPIGVAFGLRMLAGTMAGARIEYRFRQVMHDPIADFSESEVRFGLSLYLRNAGPK